MVYNDSARLEGRASLCEDIVDDGIVPESKVNDGCTFYGIRYISAYYGPILLQSRGFFKCPVPHLYLITFFYHGPDKVCPQKTHAQKCYHRYFFIKIANSRNLLP